MSKEIETEKRYLLKSIPADLADYDYKIIEDLALITGEPHPHIRLRRKGDNFLITKKYPKTVDGQLEMFEETIILNEPEFEALKKNLVCTKQKKWRFSYNYLGMTAEVDIWVDDLKGLGVIEFEFNDVAAASSFEMPDFCLVDITEEEWLAGGMLSGKSYRDLEDGLKKFGYTPVYLGQ